MAKLTEIIVAIEAEGVDKVLNALKTVDGAQAKVANSSKQSANTQTSANRTSAESWALLATGVNQAMQIMQTAIQAGKAVYDFTKEGAQLDYAAARFGNLTESIGTTSDALLKDMKVATKSMVSDADLIASGGDFMALGLAKTHDEVVRLTTVAGALGMNMNQLVLTLTNQTTMRFDALGVSVVGFDEKVKALEESGLSASEAFSEAFLQQAEEQILKVGSASDYAIGDVKRFEASIENLGNSAKEALVPIANEILPEITEKIDNLNRTQQFNRLRTDVEDFGLSVDGLTAPFETFFGQFIKTDEMLVKQMYLFKDWANTTYEGYVKSGMGADEAKAKVIELYNTYGIGVFAVQDWADANYEGEESVIKAQIAVSALNKELEEAKFSMEDYMESVSGTEAKFKFLTKNSGTYSDLLTEIETKQGELANMQPWEQASESGRELQSEIDVLLAKLDDLGEAMKMDALKTAIEANGDVTEREYQMMLDYMEQAGMISSETNKEMMKDWRDLNQFQQNLRWDAEGNIIMITDDALASIEELKEQLRSIERNIGITVSVNQMGKLPRFVGQYADTGGEGTGDIYGNALGGAVYPGQEYLWQEPGREGELLVPERYGRVMNQHEVAMALREALMPESESGKSGGAYKRPEPQKNVSVTVNATIANDFDLDKLTREIVRRINL